MTPWNVYLLYALSGFVSLGYQVAWFRIFVDRFGSTNLTFGLVVGNFIGGLGLGGLASARVTERLARHPRLADPLRSYGFVEVLVGLTAGVTLLLPLIPPDVLGAFPYDLVGGVFRPTLPYDLSHVVVTVVCVFVPCFLMGVTFPLLCRAFRTDDRFPAALYAWNTLGACTGILACEFLLLPRIGHTATLGLMAAVNIGLGAWFLVRRRPFQEPTPTPTRRRTAAAGPPLPAVPMPAALALAGAGGLLTGAFEADVLRRLQFLDCRTGAALSCISFWAILAIFAASLTVRAFPRLGLKHVKAGCVVAFLVYLALWHGAYDLRDQVHASDLAEVTASLPRDTTGTGVSYHIHHFRYGLGTLLGFTGLFVFPAFFLLSLLLPLVCNALQREGRHLGLVYGVNTLMFCGGLLLFTVVVPRVDVFYALKAFMLAFPVLVLFILSVPAHAPVGRLRPAAAAVLLLAAALLAPAGVDPDVLPDGAPAKRYPIRATRSNGAHTTYVVADPLGDLLYFDSHTMSGCNEPSRRYMRLMAHFPLLLQEAPENALLICFGVGNTAAAIAAHDSIRDIDIVELNDQVLATAPEFRRYNGDVVEDPRVRLFHDDGRRFLALADRRYDLITSEPPPPMFAGMHRLYSVEYYEAARARLTETGLMTQWLPIDQMPKEAMESSIATFLRVFPESILFVGSQTNYIIMGGVQPIDLQAAEARFPRTRAMQDLHSLGIVSAHQLFARIVKAGPTLHREFGGAGTVSDQGVGFAHAFHDPRDPSVITYDPLTLLEEIDAERLACGASLRRTVTDLGRLKYVVPDFPRSALESVAAAGRDGVGLARADWRGIERFVEIADDQAFQEKHEGAEQFLIRALKITDRLPHVIGRLAEVQTLRGQHTVALDNWRRLENLFPNDPTTAFEAGRVLATLGRYDDAAAAFRRAISLDTGRVPAYRRALGDALAAERRWTEARDAYEEALAMAPDDAAARDGRDRAVERLAR